jgi:hypothetical protein
MKDEGGRMKQNLRMLATRIEDEERRSFHPSSFRLHPCL